MRVRNQTDEQWRVELMYGKVLNIMYNIDTGDVESILQCDHKFGVEKGAIMRARRGMKSVVSH